MPAKKNLKSTVKSPYECLQDDTLQFQGRGADILVCGDMNACTTEHEDCIRLSGFHHAWMCQMRQMICQTTFNPDTTVIRFGIPAKLGDQSFWIYASLLILNGQTPGDDTGKHTLVSRSCHGRSAID